MMNPLRHSTGPAPVLRSVVFATGVVGLLATGPEGLQRTDTASRADISALSDSIKQEFDRAPQLAALSNDLMFDADQARLQVQARIQQLTEVRTQVATAESSLASLNAGATIASNLPETSPERAAEAAPPPLPQAPPAEKVPPVEQAPAPADAAPVQVANVDPVGPRRLAATPARQPRPSQSL